MSNYWPYILLVACIVVFTGVMMLSLNGLGYHNARAEKGSNSKFFLSRRLQSLRIIMAVFGSLILVIGLAGAYFEVKRVRDAHFKDLETMAQSVASGFSPDLIAPLTFTESDTSHSAYRHISEKLQIIASHHAHIHIYTMVMRDSLIVFGPRSQMGAPSEYILPGQVYQLPPEGLRVLFNNGGRLLVDPYENEYGYYLSAFAPVLKPLTSTPALMIGVDMETGHFDFERAKAATPPLVLTLILLLCLLGGAFFLTQRRVLKFQIYRWWQSPEAHFTFLIGLAIGGLIVWFSYSYEMRYRQAVFSQSSTFYAARINDYFQSFGTSLQSTFRPIHTQSPIDDALFKQRTSTLINYEFIEAYGIATKVEINDSIARWNLQHYSEKANGLNLTKKCLEDFLAIINDNLESTYATGLRGIEFAVQDSLDIRLAFVFQPIVHQESELPALFFAVVRPQVLLNDAIASNGEVGSFIIKWEEYLEDGVKKEVAQFGTSSAPSRCIVDMDSQHPALVFGRIFVLNMLPGPAFIATYPPRVLYFLTPSVLLFLILITFIVGAFTTERYRLERVVDERTSQLEASEKRFFSLFNSALEGIALHQVVRNEDGRITDYYIKDVNPAYSLLLEKPAKEIKGQPGSLIFGENGPPPHLDIFARVVESGEPARFLEFFQPLNRHFDVSVTSVGPDQFAAVYNDITEIKLATEALRESEEKYRFLVENQNDLFIKLDRKGQYLYVSPSFCRFFGKKESDLLGQVFIPQIDESNMASSFKALKNLASAPYQVSVEQKVKSVQGWRWLAWNNSALIENNRVVGFICVGREVTKRKRSELALEENQRKLQEQNDEYLALNEEYQTLNEELNQTNSELFDAIEKTQESERLKTAFLQNMSHEIRTPLNAVIGFSEMMSLSGFSEEEKLEFAEIVVNNARQLLSLVDDIMTLSTIETQQNKLSESVVQVASLFKELSAVFANNLKSGIQLEIVLGEGDEHGLAILADEVKLRQIFINLIGNAIKFTHEGSISFGYDLVKEKTIRFFVKDTGIGILPEVQDKIFERFRQAGENIQKKYGGTGLGLAISKGQVDLMGGQIWVESEVGAGSVFYFEIPLKPARV
jgi:PAS domain S-box-containing protein